MEWNSDLKGKSKKTYSYPKSLPISPTKYPEDTNQWKDSFSSKEHKAMELVTQGNYDRQHKNNLLYHPHTQVTKGQNKNQIIRYTSDRTKKLGKGTNSNDTPAKSRVIFRG